MGPTKACRCCLKPTVKSALKLPLRLVVAGANPLAFELLSALQSSWFRERRIHWLCSQKQLAEVFRCARVVVLPYNAAPGTSGVFHLACGFGRPVVASNLPEIREIVADGASAVLVPPGDVDALADTIAICWLMRQQQKK